MRPRLAEPPNYQVRALQRGLAILSAFTAARPRLTLADVSARVALPKPTALRLLECLRSEGYVEYDASEGAYRLGLGALQLGTSYLAASSLEQRAQAFLRLLVDRTGQTANLGVLDGHEVLHLAIVEPNRPLHFHTRVGAREPVHCTGLGKVLAAHLDEEQLGTVLSRAGLPRRTATTITDPSDLRLELAKVRRLGYAEDREEDSDGLYCLAAPVRNQRGSVVAAMSISGHASEFRGSAKGALLSEVMDAARRLSEQLGWSELTAMATAMSFSDHD